jgi:hypothetical protein
MNDGVVVEMIFFMREMSLTPAASRFPFGRERRNGAGTLSWRSFLNCDVGIGTIFRRFLARQRHQSGGSWSKKVSRTKIQVTMVVADGR